MQARQQAGQGTNVVVADALDTSSLKKALQQERAARGRLVFAGGIAGALKQAPADGLSLSSLASLQGILYKDGRSVGRLCNGSLHIRSLDQPGQELVGLRFEHWKPAGEGRSAAQPTRIDIGIAEVASASWKGVLLGRVHDTAFSTTYQISGRQAAASVSQHQQRLEYIERQRLRHQGGGEGDPQQQPGSEAPGNHCCHLGHGLSACQLSFTTTQKQAWLNGITFNLAYLVTPALNEPAADSDTRGREAGMASPTVSTDPQAQLQPQQQQAARQDARHSSSDDGAVAPEGAATGASSPAAARGGEAAHEQGGPALPGAGHSRGTSSRDGSTSACMSDGHHDASARGSLQLTAAAGASSGGGSGKAGGSSGGNSDWHSAAGGSAGGTQGSTGASSGGNGSTGSSSGGGGGAAGGGGGDDGSGDDRRRPGRRPPAGAGAAATRVDAQQEQGDDNPDAAAAAGSSQPLDEPAQPPRAGPEVNAPPAGVGSNVNGSSTPTTSGGGGFHGVSRPDSAGSADSSKAPAAQQTWHRSEPDQISTSSRSSTGASSYAEAAGAGVPQNGKSGRRLRNGEHTPRTAAEGLGNGRLTPELLAEYNLPRVNGPALGSAERQRQQLIATVPQLLAEPHMRQRQRTSSTGGSGFAAAAVLPAAASPAPSWSDGGDADASSAASSSRPGTPLDSQRSGAGGGRVLGGRGMRTAAQQALLEGLTTSSDPGDYDGRRRGGAGGGAVSAGGAGNRHSVDYQAGTRGTQRQAQQQQRGGGGDGGGWGGRQQAEALPAALGGQGEQDARIFSYLATQQQQVLAAAAASSALMNGGEAAAALATVAGAAAGAAAAGFACAPPPAAPPAAPVTDLQRFLEQTTPLLPLPAVRRLGGGGALPSLEALEALTLADVWRFYAEPSMVGREVATLGGARGPSAAYFVPYLSAMQLFTFSDDSHDPDLPLFMCSSGGGAGWPRLMRLLSQHVEQELPFNREPMFCQLEALAGAAGAASPLMATRLVDLHPASWFCVAWYPVYRIPDAPLMARFLTFHSLASVHSVATQARAAAAAAAGDAGSASGSDGEGSGGSSSGGGGGGVSPLGGSDGGGGGGLPLPAVGLKWYNMQGERWLHFFADQPGLPGVSLPGWDAMASSAPPPPASLLGGGAPIDEAAWQLQAQELQAQLSELQATADRLATAQGLKVLRPNSNSAQQVELRVPDYVFFVQRA